MSGIKDIFSKEMQNAITAMRNDQDFADFGERAKKEFWTVLPMLERVGADAQNVLLVDEKTAEAYVLSSFMAYTVWLLINNFEDIQEDIFVKVTRDTFRAAKYGVTDDMILKDQKPS